MKKALDGIKVLDLSRVLAGPYCTQMLGDLGAEIIKVEKPGAGDDTRQWGPPFLKDDDGNDTSESAYYLSCNRNKKSVTIDIANEGGQALIHKLLEKSDILIENFKPGGLTKYGLDYEQIKERHPHIIYCAISGFGQSGPMASEPGYDFMAQGLAGLMACTGGADQPPTKAGVALSDIMTGLNAAIGILAALHNREKTGKGQMVDVSLIDCTLASLTNIAQYYLTSGTPAPRIGNAHATIVPYNTFEAKDGYVILAVGNDRQFKRFCDFVGKSEWASDDRFATNAARVTHREIIVPLIADVIEQQSVEYWIKALQDIDVPGGPVNTMDQVFAMDQVQAREMEIEMTHASASTPVHLVGSPLKLSETPPSYQYPPPTLGQHTQEILANHLGLSADEIEKLKHQGAIGTK